MNIGRIGLLVGVALASISASAPPSADLILRGGTIYTGSDAPFVGDVAIKGDHIVEVSPHVARAATRVIDAHGMIVAPGFIDPH
ncbi:amidohydrolase, partial [Pseudomonas sp. FW305-130]